MKRIASLLLAVVMLVCTGIYFPNETLAADVAWTAGGTGTASAPYIIDTAEEFSAFMANITSGGSVYSGKYFRVDKDIVYNEGYTFTFDGASGLVKVSDSTGDLFCLGTGIPGTARHRGYITHLLWEDMSEPGKIYAVSSLTGELAEASVTNPLTAWAYTDKTTNFAGVLDFNGHSISGVYINDTSKKAAVFGNLKKSATVMNMTVKNSYFCGTSYSASIAGRIEGPAKLLNCTNESTVCGVGTCIGGILGGAEQGAFPKLIACENKGQVGTRYISGKSNANAVAGGVIGQFRGGEVIACKNSGTVFAGGAYGCGGIIGLADTGGQNNAIVGSTYIYACINTGTVNSFYDAGEYNNVEGDQYMLAGAPVGGIVGYLDPYWSNKGTVVELKYCVNTGKVRESAMSHGDFVGVTNGVCSADTANAPCSATIRISDNITVNDSHAANWEPRAISGIYTYYTSENNVRVKSTDIHKDRLIYEMLDKANSALAKLADHSYVWYNGTDIIPVGYGKNIYDEYGFVDFKQDGSAEDPVIIDSLEDLKDLRDAVNGGKHYDGVHFAITCDIDLNPGTVFNADGTYTGAAPAVWEPIGSGVYGTNPTTYFGGKLYGAKPDGTPAVIRGLYINSADTSTKTSAFVGVNKGEISCLAFENASVNAKRYAGIVTGVNLGTVKNCTVAEDCRIKLNSHVAPVSIGNESAPAPAGSIASVNFGHVTECTSSASVTSNYSHVGGIVGHNVGTVSYCTNDGTVAGSCTVGGIVGYNGSAAGLYGTVSYCGNTGDVNVTGSHAAGVVGWSRDAGGISYCYNAGTVRSTGADSALTAYSASCVAGILGCGNANSLQSGNSYVMVYCYNVGDVYNADGKKSSNDISGYVAGNSTTRYLKASTGKSDSKGIYDGIYVRIDAIDYSAVPFLELNTKQDYDKTKELVATRAVFSGGDVKLYFSEPVTSTSDVYSAIRFCTVNENGIPALKWASINGVSTPLQIGLSAKFDGTNVAILTGLAGGGSAKYIIDTAAENAGFTDYIKDCVPLLCIEGLDISGTEYADVVGILDAIKNSTQPLSYAGCYGIYPQYGEGTVTKADAKSGALCEFLNKTFKTNVFTQNIGVDVCPVIGGGAVSVKLEQNVDGTYTVPALTGNVSNSGSLVGYRDESGAVHKAGEKIAYGYVSPVYETALVLDYGAAVRVGSGDVTGIRWSAKINKAALEGCTIVNKGFIIAPTAYVTGEWAVVNNKNVKAKKVASDFTVEAFDAVGIDYIDVKVDGFTDLKGTTFAASVSNLYKENFSLGYSARAYLDIKDASGSTKRIYSGFEGADGKVYYSYADVADANSRAPGEIAKKALADLSETVSTKYPYKIWKEYDAYLQENDAKYPNEYYYSPYSLKARENLHGFILTLPAEPDDERAFYPVYDNAEEYAPMRAELRAWIMSKLQSGDGALFSAQLKNVSALGGNNTANETVSFATLSGRWQKSSVSSVKDGKDEILTVSYTDTASGLKFTTTVILYGDTPTADIKTVVKNTTAKRSQVLTDFYALDESYPLAKAGGNIKLTTLVGSYAASRDFDMVERDLTTEFVQPVLNGTEVTNQHSVFYTTASKGFSSSGDGFPYFDLIGDNKGIMMAIGWSGQWEGSFKKDANGNAVMRARQQYLRTYLEAGEQIEAPRIVLTYFTGDREYGHNIWREMMLTHYTPDNDNDPDNAPNFVAPIPANFWGGTYHKTVMRSVQKYVEKGADIDIVWFDAGWYGNLLYSQEAKVFNSHNDPNTVYDESQGSWYDFIDKNPRTTFNWTGWVQFRGDYVENEYLFPNGLEEIGKFVDDTNAANGTKLKFMLWYMIFDRHSSHPDYLYPNGNVAVSAGSTEIQILTPEEVAQYKSVYPNLADLEESDYLSKTLNDTKGNTGTSTGVWKLDLSQDAVLNKMIDYYKYMKDVKGVDAIRLDNSNGPLAYWRAKDVLTQKDATGIKVTNTEDGGNFYRMGYTENKWTLNEYKLWDALKAHSSDFFLDNTASGGRRLDIELVSRSMSLWRTDWNSTAGEYFYEAHQKMTQTLSLWIPLSTVGVAGEDDYAARSYYSASVCVTGQGAWDSSTEKDANGNYLKSESREASANKIVERTHEIADLRPYWYGNYYQLLPVTTDYTSWQAYELYREDWNEGMFVMICRPETTQTEDPTGKTLTKTVKLKGLDSCATYRIHNIDDANGDRDIYASGAELMSNGVTVTGKNKTISAYKIILVD